MLEYNRDFDGIVESRGSDTVISIPGININFATVKNRQTEGASRSSYQELDRRTSLDAISTKRLTPKKLGQQLPQSKPKVSQINIEAVKQRDSNQQISQTVNKRIKANAMYDQASHRARHKQPMVTLRVNDRQLKIEESNIYDQAVSSQNGTDKMQLSIRSFYRDKSKGNKSSMQTQTDHEILNLNALPEDTFGGNATLMIVRASDNDMTDKVHNNSTQPQSCLNVLEGQSEKKSKDSRDLRHAGSPSHL